MAQDCRVCVVRKPSQTITSTGKEIKVTPGDSFTVQHYRDDGGSPLVFGELADAMAVKGTLWLLASDLQPPEVAQLVRVKYNYDGKTVQGAMSVSVGDIVHVVKTWGGWYYGYKGEDVSGIVPCSYVTSLFADRQVDLTKSAKQVDQTSSIKQPPSGNQPLAQVTTTQSRTNAVPTTTKRHSQLCYTEGTTETLTISTLERTNSSPAESNCGPLKSEPSGPINSEHSNQPIFNPRGSLSAHTNINQRQPKHLSPTNEPRVNAPPTKKYSPPKHEPYHENKDINCIQTATESESKTNVRENDRFRVPTLAELCTSKFIGADADLLCNIRSHCSRQFGAFLLRQFRELRVGQPTARSTQRSNGFREEHQDAQRSFETLKQQAATIKALKRDLEIQQQKVNRYEEYLGLEQEMKKWS